MLITAMTKILVLRFVLLLIVIIKMNTRVMIICYWFVSLPFAELTDVTKS